MRIKLHHQSKKRKKKKRAGREGDTSQGGLVKDFMSFFL
jgi:hypothetical protein